VKRLGRTGSKGLHVESFDQVRLHQDLESTSRCGRVAIDIVAAIRGVERFGPLRFVCRKIRRRQQTAVLLEESLELLSDVALVESVKGSLDRR